jgi:CheY-like chemotaxis protein
MNLAKFSVLVVEDEPDFLQLAGVMLQHLGIREPALVSSPLEALVRLQ